MEIYCVELIHLVKTTIIILNIGKCIPFAVIVQKFRWLYHHTICQIKNAGGMANSIDQPQAAPDFDLYC